jgi:hypothetical protein
LENLAVLLEVLYFMVNVLEPAVRPVSLNVVDRLTLPDDEAKSSPFKNSE